MISFKKGCYLYLEYEESVDHLHRYCAKMRLLWELLFSMFGITSVFSGLLRDTLLSWRGFFVWQNTEEGLASEVIMFVLNGVEGQEWDCF